MRGYKGWTGHINLYALLLEMGNKDEKSPKKLKGTGSKSCHGNARA